MKLIVDSGSTKASWCIASEKGTVVSRVETKGVNPLFVADDEVNCILDEVDARLLHSILPSEIIFYGAGCIDEVQTNRLASLLSAKFRAIRISVQSDLMGAAIALFNSAPGIVCILGTGANAAYFDGTTFASTAYAGGFILGDEGSGAVLGRRLLADWVKHCMPDEIYNALTEKYGLTYSSVIDSVYRKPQPNRYLAGFAPFLAENINNSYIAALVSDGFDAFFSRNIKGYPQHAPIGFVGSVAHHFAPQLTAAANRAGFDDVRIIQSPLEALALYHTKETDHTKTDIIL